jgi:hypothetical protein
MTNGGSAVVAYDKGLEMKAEWDRQLDQVEEAVRAFR